MSEPLFPIIPADFDAKVLDFVSAAWQQNIDKVLTLALNAYDPALLLTRTLAGCKESLRVSDMGDGDAMIYWRPTDAVLGFFQYPRILPGFPPRVNMSYRLPTPEERAELSNMGH